jgi:hypothetical protein
VRTVWGILADQTGLVASDGRFWSSPAASYRSVQDPELPVTRDHGPVVGRVAYLERSGSLWCVAVVDDSVAAETNVRVGVELRSVETPLYWSASRYTDPAGGLLLTEAALTSAPARNAARAVRIEDGDLGSRGSWTLDWHERKLLDAAYEYDLTRHGRPIVIQGDALGGRHAVAAERTRAAAPVEIRSVTSIDVYRAKRELDLVISPAETPAMIYERTRAYVETFDHGAFADCPRVRNPERVRVNRDHERRRLIGKALQLDPWAEAGLTGTVKLARTQDADEALALIDDELLGVSAGFAIPPGGDQWHGTSSRRIRKALLDHVALVDEAAYPAAKVLAARNLAMG